MRTIIQNNIMGNTFSPLFIYDCTVVNSKNSKCFRAKVYKYAETFHAILRLNSTDGISYVSDNLKVKLAFLDIASCFNFQSAIHNIPLEYRKRNRESNQEDDFTINDSVSEVSVPRSDILKYPRVFYNQYQVLSGPEKKSALCDTASDFSTGSYASDVFVTDEVRLRLLDSESSINMYRKKPEKCHLKSQSAFPNLRTDQNNILFMSRPLHEYFDGISQTTGVPAFTVNYDSHDPQAITRIFDDGKTIHVYETTVAVIFRTEMDKSTLQPYFKDHKDVSKKRIEFCLYFEDPEAFEEYAAFKATETNARWLSLAGPEENMDD